MINDMHTINACPTLLRSFVCLTDIFDITEVDGLNYPLEILSQIQEIYAMYYKWIPVHHTKFIKAFMICKACVLLVWGSTVMWDTDCCGAHRETVTERGGSTQESNRLNKYL